MEEAFADNLIKARLKDKLDDIKQKAHDAKKIGKEAGTLVKSATPWGALSLASQINIFVDWAYGIAIFIAIFKDLLDWLFGIIPGVSTVIGFLVSISIGFLMLLANFFEKDRTVFQKTLLRYIALGIGTLIEILYGLNFFPFQTLTCVIIYLMALAARKNKSQVKRTA